VDKYDSDFNDSEASDDEVASEDEEEETGKRKNVYSDPGGTKKRRKYKAQPMIGKRLPPSKTAGTGVNRGLTLGSATSTTGVLSASELLLRKEATARAQSEYLASQGITAAELKRRREEEKSVTKIKQAVVSDMKTRKKDGRRYRTSPEKGKQGSPLKNKAEKKKKKERVVPAITQEELLAECVLVTEPENKKWLLGRRRMTDANADVISAAKRNDLTDVSKRFTSKGKIGVGGQGMFNCITFPKVDDVPDILKRSVKTEDIKDRITQGRTKDLKCAVTGGKARYWDPMTKMGYRDKEAFQILREKVSAAMENKEQSYTSKHDT
jgi:hypothetical protein